MLNTMCDSNQIELDFRNDSLVPIDRSFSIEKCDANTDRSQSECRRHTNPDMERSLRYRRCMVHRRSRSGLIAKWTGWIAAAIIFSFDPGSVLGYAGQAGKGSSGQNSLLGGSASSSPAPIHLHAHPYFDAVPRNVTGLVGKSSYLTCKVRNLGNKSVSWIRHRDLHILTVGSYTYSSDQRFQTTHHKETGEWTLQVKWAQLRDAGMYECQVSTQPVRSYFVNLNVVVPTASILGGPDLHVDMGSTINLTCSIRFSPEPPAYIFWYHQDEVISYDSPRGGVSIVTEKGDVTTSRLLVQHADLPDSGKYSCSPSNAGVASVRVHVLNGERPAAMQTGSAGLSSSARHILPLLLLPPLLARLRGIGR